MLLVCLWFEHVTIDSISAYPKILNYDLFGLGLFFQIGVDWSKNGTTRSMIEFEDSRNWADLDVMDL
ncbi:hypothetical protein L6452_39380 [Arctium lappa]|uniref:Uncharacterized protein n=1 Tax=Arctium lappa TaxID=4217 RepID=A0ACB8XW98_ARCLA|nr:hypothetical protein L6452_39380 [Arctium lappa]